MYKMFIYLRSNDESLINTFATKTVENIMQLNTKFHFGIIEGSALTEDKFTRVIEVITNNIDEMNQILISPEGKNLTRHLSNYMGHITTFFAQFKD